MRSFHQFEDALGVPAEITVDTRKSVAGGQYVSVRIGDATWNAKPERARELAAKIDAALASVRAAIAGDPEAVEALDAARGTVEYLAKAAGELTVPGPVPEATC